MLKALNARRDNLAVMAIVALVLAVLFVVAPLQAVTPEASAHTTTTVSYRSGNVGSVRVQLHSGNFGNVSEGSSSSSVHRWYQRANTCVRASFNYVPFGRYCTGSTGRWVETTYGGTWRLYDYNYS